MFEPDYDNKNIDTADIWEYEKTESEKTGNHI